MELDWFTKSRLGMFIHWGLYSLPGGRWDGMETPWVAEWMMRKFKVSVSVYEKLASQFNPVAFNADRWVKLAKDAGMKYIVITAKHHDGFAMFHSKYDQFNIVDATPFRRDVLRELAESCCKYGIRLGFYYSQDQDWHEANASGNTWDFPYKTPEAFQHYLDTKVKIQLTELLSNYGKVSIIWFDTPVTINPEQSQELKEFVHRLQPECLASGRIGNGKGDYDSLVDNQLPDYPASRPTEGLGTMNESWGYKPYDHHYRSSTEILKILSRMISKDTNYLLNVGPDGMGKIPVPAQRRLKKIGEFLDVNGEAVYGAGSCGRIILPITFPWGDVTAKSKAIYFWIFKHCTPEINFYGIRNDIERAEVLGSGENVVFQNEHRNDFDYHKLTLHLPKAKVKPYIIKLILKEELNVNEKSYFSSDF